MDRELIRTTAKDFLVTFDSFTKEKLEKKQEWELIGIVKEHQLTNETDLANFTKLEKIQWLTENNKNPFRVFAQKLINGVNDNESVKVEIENISNGRFLDSVGLPGQSESSRLIMNFLDKLSKLK